MISPPTPVVPAAIIHDWVGPFGAPTENARIPVSPPSDGSSLLTTVTNWIANPSLETNTTNWSAVLGSTLTRTRDAAKFGAYSLKVETPNAVAGEGVQVTTAGSMTPLFPVPDHPSSPQYRRFTGSVYIGGVWAGDLDVVTILTLDDASTVTSPVAKQSSPSESFGRIVTEPVAVPAGLSPASIRIEITTHDMQAALFYVDGASVVESQIPAVYFDGDVGGGDSYWSSTAHASPSLKYLDYYNNQPTVDWDVASVDDWTEVS